MALAQLTAWLDDGLATSSEAHVDVPHAVVVELKAAQAAVLGLPPFVDLALHVETGGRIDQPDFAIRSGWRTLGGQPARGVNADANFPRMRWHPPRSAVPKHKSFSAK